MFKRISFLITALFLLFITATAFAFNLPDTGQTKCEDSAGTEIPCAGTGQDGAYNINPMSFTDNGNGTVTDNNTDFMWQKCSAGQNNDTTCSGTAVTYNWYQASGTYDATYNPSSQDVCGSLALGGYSDWRLPTKKELISIVDYAIPYPGPTINTTYFPNTKSSGYWSSTTNARYPSLAWYVYFYYGYGNVYPSGSKISSYYVRCVRGGQYPEQSFTDNGNGTVTDNKTGLVWQQGEPGYMTWDSALSYCEGLSLGGNTDWRLPNIKELESITDDTRYNPAIDTTFFPSAYASGYWSSTSYAYNPAYAWVVPFNYGYVSNHYEYGSSMYVRCVRGGQSGSFDYYCDSDNDTYISSTIFGNCTGTGCVPVGCQTIQGDDCDDNDPAINPIASDTNCNGIDENCNGTSDENYLPPSTTCGVGACASSGQLTCQNGSTQDTCTPGQPQEEICDGIDNDCNGSVDENYVFNGFQQPINADGSSIFKAGSTILVKVVITDCSGQSISTATVTIAVNKITDAVLGTVEELQIESSGSANTGNLFRYDATAGQYIFNLSTKGYTAGTYKVTAKLDNGKSYLVNFSLR